MYFFKKINKKEFTIIPAYSSSGETCSPLFFSRIRRDNSPTVSEWFKSLKPFDSPWNYHNNQRNSSVWREFLFGYIDNDIFDDLEEWQLMSYYYDSHVLVQTCLNNSLNTFGFESDTYHTGAGIYETFAIGKLPLIFSISLNSTTNLYFCISKNLEIFMTRSKDKWIKNISRINIPLEKLSQQEINFRFSRLKKYINSIYKKNYNHVIINVDEDSSVKEKVFSIALDKIKKQRLQDLADMINKYNQVDKCQYKEVVNLYKKFLSYKFSKKELDFFSREAKINMVLQ